jgi:hypothetical protein
MMMNEILGLSAEAGLGQLVAVAVSHNGVETFSDFS